MMDKKGIFEFIRASVPSVKPPRHIDFMLEGSVLRVMMDGYGVRQNMQEDCAAFEGWIFCLRGYLGNRVSSVVLTWDNPCYSKEQATEEKHYNRFLIRVLWACRNYSWFTVDKDRAAEIEVFRQAHQQLVVNFPTTENKSECVSETNDSIRNPEAILEARICRALNEKSPLTVHHQLPVGLFDREISKVTALTPGGSSQVDLWQISHDVFRIYELKDTVNTDNRKVGILSELMYYANLTVHLVITGQIKYPEEVYRKRACYRGLQLLLAAIEEKRIRTVEAVFLADDLHPLIKDKLKEILVELNKNALAVTYRYQPVSQLL